MQRIIFCKGLPASGKSTWSKQFCIENPEFVRLNKDDIREMMGNLPFSREVENVVLTIQHKMAETILSAGKSLIIDDTNFAQKHYDYYRGIADRLHLQIDQHIFSTPLEECIDRDSKREKSVGKEVIMQMYKKYIEPFELGSSNSNNYE